MRRRGSVKLGATRRAITSWWRSIPRFTRTSKIRSMKPGWRPWLRCRVVSRTFFGWNSESGGAGVELALNRAPRGGIGEAELDLLAAPRDHAVRDSPVAMQQCIDA